MNVFHYAAEQRRAGRLRTTSEGRRVKSEMWRRLYTKNAVCTYTALLQPAIQNAKIHIKEQFHQIVKDCSTFQMFGPGSSTKETDRLKHNPLYSESLWNPPCSNIFICTFILFSP